MSLPSTRPFSLVAFAAAAVAVCPGVAGASDATKVPGHVRYDADPGESNGVNVRKSTNAQKYIIQDGGATIEPHEGCEREFASQVRCDASGVTQFVAILGDLADTIDASAMDVQSDIGGREGDDFIIGSPQAEFLVGNVGEDTIHGGGGSDDVEGQEGADRLFGEGGSDDIPGGAQHDRLFGGPASDRLRGMDGSDDLFADPGADLLMGQGDICNASGCEPDASDTSERDAVSYASYSANVRVSIDGVANDGENSGTEGDNVFTDIEYVQGGAGNDLLVGSGENNILEGMDGGDQLVGRAGGDVLFGYEGNDIFDGGGEPDSFEGGPGRDLVRYIDAPLDGDEGVIATIDGDPNDGNIFDRAGGTRDNIGLDVEDVWGSNGNDTLVGSPELNNTLRGFDGSDVLAGGETACTGFCLVPEADTLDGGPGSSDAAFYSRRNVPLTITLGDGAANDGAQDEHDNVINIEFAFGGSNDDTITGNAQANDLEGGNGADELIGAERHDFLFGEGGRDILRGNAGDDDHHARDGEVDQVQCGPGVDDVIADTIDNVANNCENVTRG